MYGEKKMKKSKKITGIAGATLIGTTVFYLKTRRKAKKERTKKEQIQQKENQQEQKKQSQKKSIQAHKSGFYEKYIKRVQDFCCALAAIIVLSPVMLVTAVLVRTKLGSPVIFKQERPGLNGKIFTLYKFRTMTDKTDANGELLPDEERLTKFGKLLRSTSLDELPELLNILKGDMSVVGPRPLLVQYLPLYNEHQARRHEVRPGFTGYAQVHGRNAITWEDKFDKDVYYVDHITFLGDWKIIFQTVKTVLKKEGISSETAATMETFHGSQNKETENI